jgi:hypothetical protein
MSQHLLTWDEWSSPGELIHPGGSPWTSSTIGGAAKNYLQVAYSQPHTTWLAKTWQLFVEAVARCESGSGQLLFGLPQSRGRQHHINRFTTRSLWKQMPGGHRDPR